MSNKLFVCLSSEYKGAAFLRRLHDEGNQVFLITSKQESEEDWPWPAIKDTFYLDRDEKGKWNNEHLSSGFSWLVRNNHVDRIVALDDFEVERAAYLREQFRMPGMGETTARHFRDKLAMRIQARDAGLPVPPFSALFNDEDVNHYLDHQAYPHVIKPRSEASASGIKKVHSKEEAWDHIHTLGDHRIQYLIEQFIPGDVFHVDGLAYHDDVLFTACARYRNTPFEVAHGGGIFQSVTVDPSTEDAQLLQDLNTRVMHAFKMKHGAYHSEYIKSRETGQFYFLETASRVGGAHLAEMVAFSTGINLWEEWAQIESDLLNGKSYALPAHSYTPAGIIISLSKYEHMPSEALQADEVVWRIGKKYHVGAIIKSDHADRITDLMDTFARDIAEKYHASLPAK